MRFVLAMTLVLSPVAASTQSPRGRKVDSEQLAVYRMVFDLLNASEGNWPSILVVRDSTRVRYEGIVYRGKLLVAHRSKIDQALIDEFETLTTVSSATPAKFHYRVPIVLFSDTARSQLEVKGRELWKADSSSLRRDMPFWVGFSSRFPGAWELTDLSRVAFNPVRTEALLHVRHACGASCLGGETIFLRKERGKWQVTERMPDMEVDGIGPGKLRYVGPGARIVGIMKRKEDSIRVAEKDSIARDRAPRRITGVVRSQLTGLPIPNVQIFYRGDPAKNNSPSRTVADSRGRFVFRNPPMGGAMLEVQCPGSGYRRGATLAAPSFYVFPASDTVINAVAPDIQPCWLPRKAHQIESGELEFGDHSNSSFPNTEESAVLAAVWTTLLTDSVSRADRSLIAATTYDRCPPHNYCNEPRVSHLEAAGVIDSSTRRDYLRKSREEVPLNRSFEQIVGARLVTSGERSYLTDEGKWADYMSNADPDVTNFWKGLRMLQPRVDQVISFTRPGFDSTRREAMVQVRQERKEGLKQPETMLLRKTADEWSVVRRHLEREVTSAVVVNGRCVAAVAGPAPSDSDLAKLNDDYIFDLVSTTGTGGPPSFRALFSADTSTRRSATLPVFSVIDVGSGERRRDIDGGTNFASGGRHFPSLSRSMQLDGSGFIFNIRRVGDGDMFGDWRHYWFGVRIGADGRTLPDPSGHFCAQRRAVSLIK